MLHLFYCSQVYRNKPFHIVDDFVTKNALFINGIKILYALLGIKNASLEYRTVGKFGKFGELSMIHQTKTIQIST